MCKKLPIFALQQPTRQLGDRLAQKPPKHDAYGHLSRREGLCCVNARGVGKGKEAKNTHTHIDFQDKILRMFAIQRMFLRILLIIIIVIIQALRDAEKLVADSKVAISNTT